MASIQPVNQVSKSLHMNLTKLHPGHMLAITLLIPAFRFLYLDYQKYLALGPGGTPANIGGYIRIKILGLFALQNPYEPPRIPRYIHQKEGCLSSLPKRCGPRPKSLGIAPHRQINQTVPPEIFAIFSAAITAVAKENSNIEEGTSCFEKHGPGLFTICPQRRTCGGEICHAHPSDGSMHLTLHPADAKIMLEAGWGERHPLARGGWLERFVPGGFVMVYAPRTEEEIDTVMELVRAAAWFVGGEDIKMPDNARRDSTLEVNGVEVENSDAFHDAKQSSIAANQALLEL